jgi:hypothetical protein
VAKKESPLLDAFESVVAASLAAAADERMVGLNLVIDIRKWTKANMTSLDAGGSHLCCRNWCSVRQPAVCH